MDLSPNLQIPLPREFEEPYFQTARNRDLGWDAGVFANAENSQLQFVDGGVVGWDADASSPEKGILFWGETIGVTSFTTPFQAQIAGPASVELTNGEVLYFVMPRKMRKNTPVQLIRANRIFFEGTRLHDLRLFAARVGTTIYFYNGLSLQDGEQGQVFGGGLINLSIFPPHQHKPALKIEPPAPAVAVLDAQATAPALIRVRVYRNGFLQSNPDDYSIDLITGLITLVVPTVNSSERFLIFRECQDAIAVATSHRHLPALKIEPLPASALLDVLVTAPILEKIELHRNGAVQSEPDDYSLDINTGFVTLVAPTVGLERFLVFREINI